MTSRLFMKTFWPCKTDQVVDLAGSGLLSFSYEESDCYYICASLG